MRTNVILMTVTFNIGVNIIGLPIEWAHNVYLNQKYKRTKSLGKFHKNTLAEGKDQAYILGVTQNLVR